MTRLEYAHARHLTPEYVKEVALATPENPLPDKVLVLWHNGGQDALVVEGTRAELAELAELIVRVIDHPEYASGWMR
jgi:hypothetical protein